MSSHDNPLFFIHVMKTAGATLKQVFRDTYGEANVYPNPDDDRSLVEANMKIAYLTGLPAERLARTRVFSGHFPFAATEMLGIETTRLTVLRQPVDRVVSHLRQVQRNWNASRQAAKSIREIDDPSLEQVYGDPYLHERYFSNHQCRVFAITVADAPRNYIAPIALDAGRLEIAKSQLAAVDVIGLTEQFGSFRDELAERFGLTPDDGTRANTAPSSAPDIPQSLLDRIAEDNVLDAALYDHAVALVAERAGGHR